MIIPKMAIEDLIASEGIADTATVGLQTAGKVVNAAGALGKAALTVKGTIGRSSVTRMGRDSILEFPAIFSAGIDTDDSIAIAKMLEKYYASLLVSIFSLRPSIALNEYSDIAEYIKSIHSNNPIPSNLRKAQHLAKESLEDTTDVGEEAFQTFAEFVDKAKEKLAAKFEVKLDASNGESYPLADVRKFTEKAIDIYQSAKKDLEGMKNKLKDKGYTENNARVLFNSLNAQISDISIVISKFETGLNALKEVKATDKTTLRDLIIPKESSLCPSRELANKIAALCKKNIGDMAGIINGLPKKVVDAPAAASFAIDSDEYCLVDDEASGLTVNGVTSECTDPDLAYECWGIQGGALNMGSINEIVTPYRRSQALLQERIDMAKGTEAVSDNIADVADTVASKAGRVITVGRNSNPTITNSTDIAAKKVGTGATMGNSNGKIDMAPTMIDVTFYLHGSKKGGSSNSASFTQQVKLGVKAMARVVSSDYVITNLVEGSKSSNPIFKFISWTRGELKLVRDLIFNVSEVKKKFKDKRKDEYGLLQMSKDRKEVDDVAKFAGNRILPYVSLIVTDYEVAQTAQVTGVDLTNYRNAKAFMERYYLLAFGIYNQNTKTLSILYDGANDFEDMSMAYIQTEQKKSMDVTKNFANMVSMR